MTCSCVPSLRANKFPRRLIALISPRALGMLLLCAMAVGALTFVEALIFRVMISLPPPTDWQGLLLLSMGLLLPVAVGLGFLALASSYSHRAGRALETRLRTALLTHLPNIPDSYFASRLLNDLAERSHAMTQLVRIPVLLQQVTTLVTRVVFVLLGLQWLLPGHGLLLLSIGFISLGLPLLLYPLIRERDMRVRTHASAAGQNLFGLVVGRRGHRRSWRGGGDVPGTRIAFAAVAACLSRGRVCRIGNRDGSAD